MGNKSFNISQIKALAEIRNNANIAKKELMIKCNLGKTSIDNIISNLKNAGLIERIGSNYTTINGFKSHYNPIDVLQNYCNSSYLFI